MRKFIQWHFSFSKNNIEVDDNRHILNSKFTFRLDIYPFLEEFSDNKKYDSCKNPDISTIERIKVWVCQRKSVITKPLYVSLCYNRNHSYYKRKMAHLKKKYLRGMNKRVWQREVFCLKDFYNQVKHICFNGWHKS